MTTPPCLPSFLSLRLFLPILPLHSPSARGTTNRNRVSSSTVTATSLPDAKLSKLHIPKLQCGSWAQAYVLPNSICTESTTTEGAPVAEGISEESNGIEDSRKTTETEARSSLATVYACTVPGWSIPGKIWMPTNQIRDLSAGAHAPRELRARAL